MGFDINRFVDSDQINEDLVCNICKGVLEDGVWSPNCEHAFCKGMYSSHDSHDSMTSLPEVCIHQWIHRRSSCPNDRQPLNIAHLKPIPRFMRNLLDKLEIKCDFVNNGCEQVFNLDGLREHLMVCDYNPDKRVECHMGCGLVLKKADLQSHNCVKSLRRIVDNMTEESQRYDRIISRLRGDISCLKNESNRVKEMVKGLQDDLKRLLDDRHGSGSQVSQSSSTSVSTLSSTSKMSRVVPNPYVLITPLQSSSPVVNDEPSSSTLITSGTNNQRLANEEPAFKRRTTTIRVASPLHSIRPIASTQTSPHSIAHSLSFAVPSYSPETIVSRSPSPRLMPTLEPMASENDSNTTISVSDRFTHSYSYITLDGEQDFEEDTEADDETSIEQINDFDIEVQTSE